jgi:hypothetical protein
MEFAVMDAEIWVKIGPTPPVDPGLVPLSLRRERAGVRVVAVDTRSPYTRDYPGSEGSKQAHYMLRWGNTRGETSPPARP